MEKLAPHDTPPEWFDKAFIEKALRNGFNQGDLEVLGYEIKMAAEAGDHYASKLFRCRVKTKTENGKTREISVIVKAIPSGALADEFRKLSMFEKEAEMLSSILPRMREILQRAYPEQEALGPVCYYHEGSPNNVMVMEDLKERQFSMADRMLGVDMDHASLVLKGLARYHAASLVIKKEMPDKLKMFDESIWDSDNIGLVAKLIESTLSDLIDDFPTWPDVDRKDILLEKLKNLKKSAVQHVVDLSKPKSTRMNVLLHGDSWVNNFMFRYDASSGKPVQVTFVDFQICSFNSPALDLQYFIVSSLRDDLRFAQVQTCLQIYHREFQETLRRLNLNLETPYDFNRLQKEFDKLHVWGLVVFVAFFPIMRTPSREAVDPEKLLGLKENSFRNGFQRENLRKVLTKGLLYFEEKGVF